MEKQKETGADNSSNISKKKITFSIFEVIILLVATSLFVCLINTHSSEIYHSFSNIGISEKSEENQQISEEKQIVNICSNLSLIKSVDCVMKKIEPIYRYTETSDLKNLSFKQLKNRGGDCRDWALLYEKLGKDLGFYSESFVVNTSLENDTMIMHRFTIISNKEGFCLLSNNKWDCSEFG